MARKPWGARFAAPLSERIEAFTSSLREDARLLRYDIAGSIAHARMLRKVGLVSQEEARRIEAGLRQVLRGLEAGELAMDPALEDVHRNVEALLTKLVGEAGKRLHTGRSRNDQVALDLRLLARERALTCAGAALGLHALLLRLAERHARDPMPGYTHLQRAQPVTLGHHLLARAAQLERDAARFLAAFDAANLSPLGAGAIAGTSLPVDRVLPARLLGFDGLVENTQDATSDRDFLLEGAGAASLAMVHASGLAQELVVWATQEFGFLDLGEGVATGSSLMPQKKNPDALELVRAKAGTVHGCLAALYAITRGLPLGYNRDLQEAKAPYLQAMDATEESLRALREVIAASRFRRAAMRGALADAGTLATLLAEHLVRKGVAFRDAHEAVGRLAGDAERAGRSLASLGPRELAKAHPGLGDAAPLLRRPAPPSRGSRGGPSPGEVARLLRLARAAQRGLRAGLQARARKHAAAERLLAGPRSPKR